MLHETVLLPSGGVTLETYCPYVMTCDTEPEGRISVLICPGGGYDHLSEREAEPVALAFAAMGFNAFVIKYRVAPARYPSQLHDVASALHYIRENSGRYHAAPRRIALCGFSAGGHLAASFGAMWQDAALWEPINLKPEDVQPDALILCYPVIDGGKYAHRGSFAALTGTDDIREHEKHSVQSKVTSLMPPSFIWHTRADAAVPVQNSLLLASALSEAGVDYEMHIFPKGPHGLALANSITSLGMPERVLDDAAMWPGMAGKFLKSALTR